MDTVLGALLGYTGISKRVGTSVLLEYSLDTAGILCTNFLLGEAVISVILLGWLLAATHNISKNIIS